MKKNPTLHSYRALRNATAHRNHSPIEPGKLVHLLRERLHMNQRQLARRCGIPQSHLTRIEQGKGDVQYGSLRRIFQALFCQPILNVRPEKDFDAILAARAHVVAERRIRKTLGTMALENQEPDRETTQELLRREERRLLNNPSAELWDDEAI